ncbi:MAG TPA: hypothetical protein VEC19_05250 [Usitatibacter sp.]|nr:hypothetical protein [Usitatibacter sp.]
MFRNISWALATAAAVLAGCATAPPAHVPAGAPQHHGAAMDLGSKFKVPNRERGRRGMALMNKQYQLETEADEKGPPTAAQFFRAHEQREAIVRRLEADGVLKSAGITPSQWQEIGPSNVAGRIRAIAFDPANARRMLVGTASGGLWISEDQGVTWRANHDFLPNLSISAIVFDPVNPAVVYLGTGEASAGLVGVGAFKSTDRGVTWSLLPATNFDVNPDWRYVNRLAVHPALPSVVVAGVTNNNGVTGAIYRSTDGGASWAKVSSLKALDMAFEPSNANNVLAGLDDGAVAYSRDAGLTWTRTTPLVADPSGRGNTARIEIAFAASQPGTAYASVDNANGEVWRSLDSGATWTKTATPAHLASQGDYDNAIWVDPIDANHVLVAGLDIYQSFDAGATFTKVSDWNLTPESPHADHHALVSPPDYGPNNRVLFNGNDGGIYRALDATRISSIGTGWANMNNGLAVTQFYSGAGRTAAGGKVIGGTQDNGSLALVNGSWVAWRGGDGGFVAVDPQNDQTIYGELYYAAVFRSTNGGGFATYICTGITEAYNPSSNKVCGANTTQKANFISPFILDPNNPARMLVGANSLWVTDNLRLQTAPAWRVIKQPSPATDNFINAIAVHEGNGNLIWVGHNNGEVYRTQNGLSATPTWTRVGQGVLPARRVQRITVDRANPNRAIVSVTGFVPDNVWQTLDGGATWTSITHNLPSVPVFDVKIHPHNGQWLYAATSVGVFTSEDGGASWSTTNEGPANIRVRELFWLDDNTLGAATYGRGMFKTTVASGGPASYQDLWWAGTQENGWGMSITQHGSTIFAAFFIYDAHGRPIWVVLPAGTWNASGTTYSGALYAPTGSWFGSYDVSRLSVGASVGTASLAFNGANSATLTYTINGVSGTKSITRQGFGPVDPTPIASYADLWWGGLAQNGWGVAISQQYRTLFAVWYTYDEQGRTVWYVVPGGEWISANAYRGTAYRTSGSPWLGAAYNPAAFNAQPSGTVTFTFHDVNNATMGYTIDGVSGSKPITRQPF